MELFYVPAIACTALISGCMMQANSQSDLRSESPPTEYKSVKTSKALAFCIEDKWKKIITNPLIKVQLQPTINGYSVWVKASNRVSFLADIDDVQGGSTTRYYDESFAFVHTKWRPTLIECLDEVSSTVIITTESSTLAINNLTVSRLRELNMDCHDVTDCRQRELNMSCRSSDCEDGFSCRLSKDSGTECRADNIQQSPTGQAKAVDQSTQATPIPVAQKSEQTILSKPAFDEYNELKYTKSGGVYLIPVLINDVLQMKFIIDTGASDVNISPDVYLTLLKTGTIKKSDRLPSRHYQLADGSIVKSDRFIIRTIKIGNRVLKNVSCSISDSINADMLLGQSALEQLGNFTFHYDTGTVQFKNELKNRTQ